MTTPTHLTYPFAQDGDLLSVPDTSVGDDVNFKNGFGPAYDLAPDATGSQSINRSQFNDLLYRITSNLKWWQEQTHSPWLSIISSGVGYGLGSIVNYDADGKNYISNSTANSSTPGSDTNWSEFGDLELLIIARGLNTLRENILRYAVGASIPANITHIYVSDQQKTYAKPSTVGDGETITSIIGADLVTSGGGYSLEAVATENNKVAIQGFVKYGKFINGATLSSSNQALFSSDGFWYAYHGDLSAPVVVPAGSLPSELPSTQWSCVGLLNGEPVNHIYNYGVQEVQTTGGYTPAVAWSNRVACQLMLRNKFYSEFDIDGRGGLIYLLSSVHPLRDNITIRINSGAKIIGRYDDPSIAQSTISQGGHIFGMVHYSDPDNNDFTVTARMENSVIKLDGDISSEFNAVHTKANGNNPIGWFWTLNCHTTGDGGVSSSDHKGIVFDGDAQNSSIDVGYVNDTANSPLVMKGDATESFSLNTVKCANVSQPRFDGGGASDVVFSRNNEFIDIHIGMFNYDGVTKAQLVSSGGDGNVTITYKKINGATQICRHADTRNVSIIGYKMEALNTDYICVRNDSTADVLEAVSIEGVVALGDMVAMFKSENRISNFKLLSAKGNDFSLAGSAFVSFDSEFGDNNALEPRLNENIHPAGFASQYLNKKQQSSVNLANGSSSFTWDYTDPDESYTFITIRVSESSSLYVDTLFLETLTGTSAAIALTLGASTYNVTRVGTVLTFARTSGVGNLINAIAHN